jgi:hypothetical protein
VRPVGTDILLHQSKEDSDFHYFEEWLELD